MLPFNRLLGEIKFFKMIVAIISLCGIVGLVFISPAIQSNQSVDAVNRISFSYKAPYYRVYEYCRASGDSLLVYVDPAMRASLYVTGLSNVELKQMVINETRFDELFNEHDRVFIYQEKWPLYMYVVEENFIFISSIIKRETDYEINVIWETPEAYFYEVME